MWYEKPVVIVLINIISLITVLTIMFWSYTFSTWPLWVVLVIYAIINMYNSLMAYNRAIDRTVNSLAKHYEKQMVEEIQKAVKKAMGM